MNDVTLYELALEMDAIIIGEQFKGGTFRPCLETIPASTIAGALYHHFGVWLPAVGLFVKNTYIRQELTYAVRDRRLNISKVPITTSYLTANTAAGYGRIRACIYLPRDASQTLSADLAQVKFHMGALRHKGFGRCQVVAAQERTFAVKQGMLNVRMFAERLDQFGLTILAPKYGYLFRLNTVPPLGGVYHKALFEGSLVKAPTVLLQREEETYYDE